MNPSLLADEDFYPLIEARHCDPFRILGLREFQGRWIGRVFRPDAAKARVVDTEGKAFDLTRIHESGLFEAVLPDVTGEFGYTLEFTGHDGTKWR